MTFISMMEDRVTLWCRAACSMSFPLPAAPTPASVLSSPGTVVHIINQPFLVSVLWLTATTDAVVPKVAARQAAIWAMHHYISVLHTVTPLEASGNTHTDHWWRFAAYHLHTCTIQLPKHRHVVTKYRHITSLPGALRRKTHTFIYLITFYSGLWQKWDGTHLVFCLRIVKMSICC